MPFVPTDFVPQADVARGNGLGHSLLNRLDANSRFIDASARFEHRASGVHNALEVPFLLGKIAYPNAYLFDSTWYSSVSNPATGRYEITAQAALDLLKGTSCLINVSDSAVSSKPHMAVWQPGGGSDTHKTPISIVELATALGTGSSNSWAAQNRTFDFALHAQPVLEDPSGFASTRSFLRGDYLTTVANGWNSIVSNQELARKTLGLEHTANGDHNIGRIAKGILAAKPIAGPSMGLVYASGALAQVNYVSTGWCGVSYSSTSLVASSLNNMVAFVNAVPATPGEMVIAHAIPTSVTGIQFAVFTYVFNQNSAVEYTGNKWLRADRAFTIEVFYT